MNKFQIISINEARKLAQLPEYIVIDLRSRQEFYSSHIENAINVPDATLEDINSFKKFNSIWILYCRRGSLSFKLAKEMADVGYNVIAVIGGYK